jgi:anti-sigma28 factor (negative regulator of flagellin synthesis)
MSSIAFSNFTPSNVTQMATTARTGPSRAETAPTTEEDTVKLSAAAQAATMHQAGQSISSIASFLGTNVSTVDSYLGIPVAVAVPLTAAPSVHVALVAKVASAAI